MTKKQAISPEAIATNGKANSNDQTTSAKREVTQEEHLQKANRLMEKAWDIIYEENQEAQTEQNSNV